MILLLHLDRYVTNLWVNKKNISLEPFVWERHKFNENKVCNCLFLNDKLIKRISSSGFYG